MGCENFNTFNLTKQQVEIVVGAVVDTKRQTTLYRLPILPLNHYNFLYLYKFFSTLTQLSKYHITHWIGPQ